MSGKFIITRNRGWATFLTSFRWIVCYALKHPFSLQYINYVLKQCVPFLQASGISISSGRDSALQLTSMLVGRQLNIAWVVPTRLRSQKTPMGSVQTTRLIPLFRSRIQIQKDREWAIEVLAKFDDPHKTHFKNSCTILQERVNTTQYSLYNV